MIQNASPTRPRQVSGDPLKDPGALMRLGQIGLRARLLMHGLLHGRHRSPRQGFASQFTEYRAYTPGDDLRYLDWRLLARTDRCYLKKFEDETALRVLIVVDCSRSMGYHSIDWSKLDVARTLAATLAHLVDRQGDAAGLFAADHRVRAYLPPRRRTGQLRRLVLDLERLQPGEGGRPDEGMAALEPVFRRRQLICWISDLLGPVDPQVACWRRLRASHQDLIVFQVLDPAEVTFPFDKPLRFVDAESAAHLDIDPLQARAGYLKRLHEHQQALREGAESLGLDFVPLRTDQSLLDPLHRFLSLRERRMRVLRAAGPARRPA